MVTMDKPFKSRERNNELAVKKHLTSIKLHYLTMHTFSDMRTLLSLNMLVLNMQNRMLFIKFN